MSNSTQAERLARIEALLEPMALDISAIKTEVQADKAELAQLKNRGVGILIGIALVAAVLGAKARAMLEAVIEALR